MVLIMAVILVEMAAATGLDPVFPALLMLG
jgi:hypothetical protein